MKAIRIATPFVFSAVLFLLSYLSLYDGGYIWFVFLAIGFVIALFGAIMAARD